MFVNGSYTPVLPSFFGEGPSYGRANVSRDPSGQITLSTGPGNDAIGVARGLDGLYHVNVNGQDFAFNRAELSRLAINTGRGFDQVHVAGNVDVPFRLDFPSGSRMHVPRADASGPVVGGVNQPAGAIASLDAYAQSPGLPFELAPGGGGLPLPSGNFDPGAAAALIQMMRGQSPFGPGALGGAGGGFAPDLLGGYVPGPGSPFAQYFQGLEGLGRLPAGEGMSVREASAVLQQNFEQCSENGKFGKSITKKSLENAIASDTTSPEVKAAANAFLNNPQALEVITKAHSDGPSSGMTKGDLNTVLSPGNRTLDGLDALNPNNLPPGSQAHAIAEIRKHWDQVGTGKFNTASKSDLERVLSSDSAPPELKEAVNQVLNTPGLYERLKGPFGISVGDLNKAMSPGWGG